MEVCEYLVKGFQKGSLCKPRFEENQDMAKGLGVPFAEEILHLTIQQWVAGQKPTLGFNSWKKPIM